MMNNFQSTNSVYRTAANVSFVTHKVSHSLLREFSFSLQNLIRELGNEIEIEDWKIFTNRLKKYRFEQIAAPIGFNNFSSNCVEESEKLKKILHRLKLSTPHLAKRGENLLEIFDELITTVDNPLLDKIIEIVEETDNPPLVINESRLVKLTENALSERNLSEKFAVYIESQLRNNLNFEQIACFGASRWYRDYIFNASRAEKIHIIQFDWLRDGHKRKNVFINSITSKKDSEIETENRFDENESENLLNSEDIILNTDDFEFVEKFIRSSDAFQEKTDSAETVAAKFFVLEENFGVFLEEDTLVLIIDLDSEYSIRKRRVKKISSDDFIVLRDGGGGDLIVPIANRLLGKRASKLREFQRAWKLKLREAVEEHGAKQVIRELKSYGSKAANKQNLRNWLSERNIETRKSSDFAALMKLIGWEDDLEKSTRNAKRLRNAHQRAGKELKQMLIQKIAEADLSRLEKYGRMDFELTKSSGKMIALRVIRQVKGTFDVETAKLNKHFQIEGDF